MESKYPLTAGLRIVIGFFTSGALLTAEEWESEAHDGGHTVGQHGRHHLCTMAGWIFSF